MTPLAALATSQDMPRMVDEIAELESRGAVFTMDDAHNPTMCRIWVNVDGRDELLWVLSRSMLPQGFEICARPLAGVHPTTLVERGETP